MYVPSLLGSGDEEFKGFVPGTIFFVKTFQGISSWENSLHLCKPLALRHRGVPSTAEEEDYLDHG